MYKLKVMAAARLLAEVTALALVALLPLILILHGDFFHLPWAPRVLLCLSCVVALILVPAYGFVTYQVKVDSEGIETFSLFRRQFAAWRNVKALQLKTAWGMRRYVVKAEEGIEELTFPIWLNHLNQLCQTIRARLPKGETGGAGGPAGPKMYRIAPSAVALQIVRVVAGLLIIGLFWQFALTMKHDPQHSADHMFMIAVCTVFSAFWLVHAGLLLVSPHILITDVEGMRMTNWLGQRQCPWSQLKGVAPASFLLPEGLIARTQSALFFISDQLDAFDELQDDLLKRVIPDAVTKPDRQKNA